jgi:CDP-diacylglycerol--serine O-phosphatidyltransferase
VTVEQQEKQSKRGKRLFPLAKLIPNALTLLALSLGLTAVRFGLAGKYEMAVLSICGAAFLDMLDGRIARLLKAESPMGAQLDSLADFMSFGLAPILVLYVWGLSELHRAGWMVLIFFGACCALRLARFNATIDDPDRPQWMREYFIGVPTPAAGILVLAPIWLQFSDWLDLRNAPWVIIGYTVSIACLMVSRFPTFSGKGRMASVPREHVLPIMVSLALLAAGLFTFPWFGLSLLCVLYVAALPFGYASFQRRLKMVSE